MIFENVIVGPIEANCYILAAAEGKHAIIIDPGAEERKITKILDKYRLKPGIVINTHGHYDHIGVCDKFHVPVYIHERDADYLKDPELNLSGIFAIPYQAPEQIKTVKEGDIINSEGISFKVIHVPGHTPGGIALLMLKPQKDILFTGDTLFCQGIGRSDLPGGNGELLVKSIKDKLFILSDDTAIYPGHGPSSTIGEEKERNPFLV
jgi:glyoxylase-like metal-dependent hydrolase (beta-lactamase superfamily II)